jgi:septum formation protein
VPDSDRPKRPVIVLASASPRRSELLQQMGVPFRVCPADVDERVLEGESPADYALRLARAKAAEVMRGSSSGQAVLGADTAVVVDGAILGKPADEAEARDMLGRLSGRSHEVYSAVALALPSGAMLERLNVTRVTFAPLDRQWIEAYLATGDSMDKAGAYGVQGPAAARIQRIEGSFSGVMGLPMYETYELLHQAEVLF